jgi:glutamate-1-semialdehyde aminotransferase
MRLAELSRRIPSMQSLRFTNSGTEATMNAVRVARAFTGRPKMAKFEGAYHGTHDWALVSVTRREGFREPHEPEGARVVGGPAARRA